MSDKTTLLDIKGVGKAGRLEHYIAGESAVTRQCCGVVGDSPKLSGDLFTLTKFWPWVTFERAETPETVAFRSTAG
ncbi:hypothetical protein GCM10007385_43950 [Tateyamaria omphalii]|nr:hypothetical protein GCM10007385_43950 [Tateyamaria omphalii]